MDAAPTTPLAVDCVALLDAVGARALARAEENVVAAVDGVEVELEVDADVLDVVAAGGANADCSPVSSVLICVTRASASV
ncbi:MAG: hypothetical protein ACLPZR_18460 [Solirubrobacteraceae bacterium]